MTKTITIQSPEIEIEINDLNIMTDNFLKKLKLEIER